LLSGCDWRAYLLAPEPPGISGTVTAPVEPDPVSHLLARLSYGPRPEEYARVSAMGAEPYIEEQLHPEGIDDNDCEWLTRRLETLRLSIGELFEFKQELLRRELTHNALLRAVYSKRQLQEVMVAFWTDHFNIDISKGDCPWLKTADDRDVIRPHALGRFPEMLRASAISPAMLWYLDGRANKKTMPDERPNENYARELLELHTLGVHGGYTQQDVMEVARCLTGWTVRSEEFLGKGRVEFRPENHDDGDKTVLGQRILAGGGAKDLDAVMEIVALHPSTAKYLAQKLCLRFISDAPPPEAVDAVAEAFLASKGDIAETLRALFGTPAFQASVGQKLKRPFHYIASALRATASEVQEPAGIYEYLQRMGHSPYQFPTPDGYPNEAAAWRHTLLWRWHFALALHRNEIPGVTVDWERLEQAVQDQAILAAHLLQRRPSETEREAIAAAENSPAVILASPAFQRC
jgi:uncharacterized protein (DUF1800 family)